MLISCIDFCNSVVFSEMGLLAACSTPYQEDQEIFGLGSRPIDRLPYWADESGSTRFV